MLFAEIRPALERRGRMRNLLNMREIATEAPLSSLYARTEVRAAVWKGVYLCCTK